MGDGKTIYCVYPLGHGGPSAVLKKSTDGGLTWSQRLPVPDNWKTSRDCPCIHRLTDPQGKDRLFVFEGAGDVESDGTIPQGAMRQSHSTDGGKTWTPLEPNGLHCVVAPITIVPIERTRLLAMYHRGKDDRDRSPLELRKVPRALKSREPLRFVELKQWIQGKSSWEGPENPENP